MKENAGGSFSGTQPQRVLGLAVRLGLWSGLALCFALALTACGGGDPDLPQEDQAAQQATEQPQSVPGGTSTAKPRISVKALLPVSLRNAGWPMVEVEYRLVVQNKGPAVDGVRVELIPPGHGVQVIDGIVNAGSLAANSLAVPRDTIKVRKHWAQPFALLSLAWRITYGPPLIVGTAAVGAALANGNVEITDADGLGVCAEPTVVTTGTGAFTCTVLADRSAPFVIVVRDPFDFYPPLVSIVPMAPTAGTTLVANATPITTAIVAQLAPDGNALSVLANRSLIDLAALSAITTNVLTQIAPVLTALNAPPGYNPFTTQIVAGTITQGGNTADQVIEALRFSTVDGVPMIATVDNPAGTVPLANAADTSPPVLPPPSLTLLSLADAMRLAVNDLGACFALPVNARVLAFDASVPLTQGGPEVTSMAPACQAIAHAAYLNGGYRLGQSFYSLLQDPTMVGATFSPAEIMLLTDDNTAADQDAAVVNLRYLDANGVAGNRIEVVRKLPGSATAAHPSDWWIYGNQQVVESRVRAFIHRGEQLAPAGTPPFTNSSQSQFLAGIELFVNKDGPGSTGLRAARLKGPALPASGVVYTRPDPVVITNQTWLSIRRKDGLTDPLSATVTSSSNNVFLLQRTQGLAGSAPLPERPNPNAGNDNNTQFQDWAHPLDYGAALGTPTTSYIDFSTLRANTFYTLELFYDGEPDTVPRHTYTKTMLTPVTPATHGVNLRWHALTPATLDYLNPGRPLAGPLTSATIAWTPDTFAETVGSVGFYSFSATLTVNNAVVPVPRGATSVEAAAPQSAVFQPLTADATSGRRIQLRHRMLDGSFKNSEWRYN